MSGQVAADLRAAADVLARDGWTQGEYHRPCGRCALGAIGIVTGAHVNLRSVRRDDETSFEFDPLVFDLAESFDAAERERRAQRALADAVKIALFVVPEWNDDPHRTADEVIAALRAAADRAEADQ